jgi:flagellar assembly protein FliH
VILEAEHQILELAIAISRKIVRTEITINPAVIEETLKQALAKVTDRDTITLYLNTTDVELVTKRRSEILKKLDPGSRVNIIEDENIEPGGLVITTNLGNIDATISGQELEIDRFLKQIHEQNQQET